jgi:hypothetical protein
VEGVPAVTRLSLTKGGVQMKRAILILAVMGLLFGGMTQAKAGGLIGSTVNSTYYFPTPTSVYEDDGTQVVNPTASFLAFDTVGELVTNTQIILSNPFNLDTSFTSASFNGPVFDFIGSGNLITGVTIDSATNVSPVVTLTSDGSGGQLISINLQGQPFVPGFNVTLDVATGTVPEPSTLMLAGIGALAVAGYTRLRRRAK